MVVQGKRLTAQLGSASFEAKCMSCNPHYVRNSSSIMTEASYTRTSQQTLEAHHVLLQLPGFPKRRIRLLQRLWKTQVPSTASTGQASPFTLQATCAAGPIPPSPTPVLRNFQYVWNSFTPKMKNEKYKKMRCHLREVQPQDPALPSIAVIG